ncbi:MAG: UPF0149 family protein [Mariprofundaceae bacterium]|nr:UPF0149 family protein [Mariprofundaceae bacterium]
MNQQQCLDILSKSEHELPKDALIWALQHYDEVKAELHTALALSPERIQEKTEQQGVCYNLQYYAFYLAAEKRDTQALPIICNFFDRYGEQATDAMGDFVTEVLAKILASVGHKQPQILFEAAQHSHMDRWARGACVHALCSLMYEELLDREQLVAWLLELLLDEKWGGAEERSDVLFACKTFGLVECKDVALRLLKDGKLEQEEGICEQDISSIERDKVEHGIIHLHYHSIDDAVAFLETSYDFHRLLHGLSSAEFLTVEENGALFRYLKELPHENPEAFLHAYLFAIVHTPDLIMPSEWLEPLLDLRVFENMDESNEVVSAIMGVYNRLNEQWFEGDLDFPIEQEDLVDVSGFDTVESWSAGFLRGICLRSELWGSKAPNDGESVNDIAGSWVIIMALADQDVAEEMFQNSGRPDNEQERAKSLAMFLGVFNSAVATLVEHAQNEIVEKKTVVRQPKVGRNEPCPCGSGKKFKKCCGNPAHTVH